MSRKRKNNNALLGLLGMGGILGPAMWQNRGKIGSAMGGAAGKAKDWFNNIKNQESYDSSNPENLYEMGDSYDASNPMNLYEMGDSYDANNPDNIYDLATGSSEELDPMGYSEETADEFVNQTQIGLEDDEDSTNTGSFSLLSRLLDKTHLPAFARGFKEQYPHAGLNTSFNEWETGYDPNTAPNNNLEGLLMENPDGFNMGDYSPPQPPLNKAPIDDTSQYQPGGGERGMPGYNAQGRLLQQGSSGYDSMTEDEWAAQQSISKNLGKRYR